MGNKYSFRARIISSLSILPALLLSLLFTSCAITMQERQQNAIPEVEIAAKKIVNLMVKDIAPNTGRDAGYDYSYKDIVFNDDEQAIIVPIKFYWTAKEFQLFSPRLYCATIGNLTIIKGSAWFVPKEYNQNLETIAGKNWYNKDYSVTLDHTRRIYQD